MASLKEVIFDWERRAMMSENTRPFVRVFPWIRFIIVGKIYLADCEY